MTDTGKVAIVTGASRGFGAAIAERLAADGFTVVVNYGRPVEAHCLVGLPVGACLAHLTEV